MEYKEDWDKARERFCALWNREIVDRCCISVKAPKSGGHYTGVEIPDTGEDLIQYWTDPEQVLRRNLNRIENTYFGGEAAPNILINFGPEAHAAYFGAPYHFRKTTVWFDPMIQDWEKDKLVFDRNNEFYRKHKELARYLAAQGKGRYLVSMSDNASASDALAYLRGSENLLLDLALNPKPVKEALDIITDEWMETEREFFEISRDCNGGGSCVGWLDTWAPGYHTHIQCDLSVMISSATFEEFFAKQLRRACDTLDYSIYHLDGIEQVRHLDLLLSIENLDMIQWTSVEGQAPPTAYIPILKKIQAAGKCLHLSIRPDQIEPLLTELSSKGLFLATGAENEEEAKSIIKLVEKLTRE